MTGMYWDESTKRTLGIRDRQILWEKAGHRCQSCGKEIDFTEMQVGHKTAFSKGGETSLRNSVCLCYKCNKLQGTDSWQVFMKKMGKVPESSENKKTKDTLKTLNITQLKFLAKKYNVKVRGTVEQGLFSETRRPPTKAQYLKALAQEISGKDISSALKEMPLPVKRKKKRSSSWF
jgi:hypothetical protein